MAVHVIEHSELDEIQPDSYKRTVLHLGSQTIELQKLFGPTIFADIRVTPNLERGGWVVERDMGKEGWKEFVCIPAQLESDFEGDEE